MSTNKRVLLGMSGGVDSSVSAILLQKQGFEVIGGFMKNWSTQPSDSRSSDLPEDPSARELAQDGKTECSWRTERRDAMRVASQLGIEFHTFDLEEKYRQHVYEYMIHEYKEGRTPNPDVLCNKYMKFGYFIEEADKLGCEYVATGHYARVKQKENTTRLLAGKDNNKDQSYFLCRLTQEQLKRALFPVGNLRKPKVRQIATRHNLPVANKKDSQGICFVGKVALQDFLQDRLPKEQGDIITTDGRLLGKHDGHMYYTIGQRHGLGIGGGEPYFVVERNAEKNQVIVGHNDDPALYNKTLTATELTETYPGALRKARTARIRYRQKLQHCNVELRDGEAHVTFKQAQRAVAPGQFIAFYKGSELLGSGIIA